MITFITGLLILAIGSLIYSNYVEHQFGPKNDETPAIKYNDGVDYMPLSTRKNMFIQLLNIAGMGPILGAIQGALFGPVAFIIIPLGAVIFGGVHDYFAGMLSVRNKGEQVVSIVHDYLGKRISVIYIWLVGVLLLLLTTVFVFTSGDIIAERFFAQHDFSLYNPVVLSIYLTVLGYFILATLFPIDKIIGRFYPYISLLLLIGTALIVVGFFTHGVQIQELNFSQINEHPLKLAIIPMFFMTVSCGLLSGFHSTQSTIISRTLKSEFEGKKVFYFMMIVESLIAMIWAAAAMSVYNEGIVPQNIVGTANVVNIIADRFVPLHLAFIVTIAVVILPITSGDTAMRSLRMIIAEQFNLSQKPIKNRLLIVIPMIILLMTALYWAKVKADSFSLIWRYFNFSNQLISIPVLLSATVFLYRQSKNYFITLIPGLFYTFITFSFILTSNIGLNLNLEKANIISIILVILVTFFLFKNIKNKN